MRRGGRSGDPEALRICQRALELKSRLLQEGDPSIAVSEENLGALYVVTGDLSSARSHLERALDIRTRAFGQRNPAVARSLLYLGNLEFSEAKDEEARRLVQRAIAIQDSTLSTEDPARAEALTMLAGIEYERGEYREAWSAYEQVLSLQTRTLASDHPYTASTLHNLGSLASEMGDHAEARWYLERALAMMRRVLRPGHPLIARTLTALAFSHEAAGEPGRARSLYRQVLAMQRKSIGTDHSEYAWTLTRLGRLELERHDYARARATLRDALRIQVKTLGDHHPDVAWTLEALAQVDVHDRDLKSALDRSTRALAIREDVLGPRHPDVAPSLAACARIHAMLGDSALALDMAAQSARIRAEHLLLTAGGLSERQAIAYAALGPSGVDVALSLVARPSSWATPALVRQAWDVVVQTRTLVLDEVASRQQRALADSGDAGSRLAMEALRGARQRLANLLVRGPGEDSPERYHDLVRRARLDMEHAERDLGGTGGSVPPEAPAPSEMNDILAALPARHALVAYAAYASDSSREYVAFVRGASGATVVVPLGDARRLESLVRRWASDVLAEHAEQGPAAVASEAAARRSGESLRRAIWDPLVSVLGNADDVFVVPAGVINEVNLGALPEAGERYLVEGDLVFHYLASERDLVPVRDARVPGSGLLAVGGVDYGPVSATSEAGRPSSTGSGEAAVTTRTPGGATGDCGGFRGARFPLLPQSRAEVEEIGADWSDPREVTTITGRAATEAAFKRLAPGKRVLHLATHGFIIDPEACMDEEAGTRGIGGLESPVRFPPRPSFNQESPLLLSGLALADANRRSEATPHEEDGILTAEEVASLDLRGVEWVVLSACDTGSSTSARGEGILGLRRAFKTAGVGTLVVSIWPVEDQAARDWMRAFYHARIRAGAGTAAAVRSAMLEVLRSRRAQGRSTSPFFWAAFLATGD